MQFSVVFCSFCRFLKLGLGLGLGLGLRLRLRLRLRLGLRLRPRLRLRLRVGVRAASPHLEAVGGRRARIHRKPASVA